MLELYSDLCNVHRLAQLHASLMAGCLTTSMGYYMLFVIASSVLMFLGTGLLTTFTINTIAGKRVECQIIFGAEIQLEFLALNHGCPSSAASKRHPHQRHPRPVRLVPEWSIDGSCMPACSTNSLNSGLCPIPGLNAKPVVATGTTSLRDVIWGLETLGTHSMFEIAPKAIRVSFSMVCFSAWGTMGRQWESVAEIQAKR